MVLTNTAEARPGGSRAPSPALGPQDTHMGGRHLQREEDGVGSLQPAHPRGVEDERGYHPLRVGVHRPPPRVASVQGRRPVQRPLGGALAARKQEFPPPPPRAPCCRPAWRRTPSRCTRGTAASSAPRRRRRAHDRPSTSGPRRAPPAPRPSPSRPPPPWRRKQPPPHLLGHVGVAVVVGEARVRLGGAGRRRRGRGRSSPRAAATSPARRARRSGVLWTKKRRNARTRP